MNRKDFKILGEEFKGVVRDFANTGDFRKIGRDVSNTVNSALDVAFNDVRAALRSIQTGSQQFDPMATPPMGKSEQKPATRAAVYSSENFPHKPIGKVAGILYTVFGSIMISVFGALQLSTLAIGYFASGAFLFDVWTLWPTLFVGTGILMTSNGLSMHKRFRRYQQYLTQIRGRSTCMIRELASRTGSGEKYVARDLRKMIAKGIFPQARLDEKKTFIMLNRESYELYLEQQENIKAQELEKRESEQKQKEAARKDKKAESAGTNAETPSAMEEGKQYLQQIRDAKAAITDAEVSAKVRRLEEIISVILEYAGTHPEKHSKVRRFMAYYLPTTIKLLNAYREFDRQPVQGDNIAAAKLDIKNALDTINHAFENLLDSLFENAAMDVSAEISVLRTVLAQDGLTNNGFK